MESTGKRLCDKCDKPTGKFWVTDWPNEFCSIECHKAYFAPPKKPKFLCDHEPCKRRKNKVYWQPYEFCSAHCRFMWKKLNGKTGSGGETPTTV